MGPFFKDHTTIMRDADGKPIGVMRIFPLRPGAYLLFQNLSRLDLTGVELPEAIMTETNLICTCLHDANLAGAWLNGANLDLAELHNANLAGAHLNEANLNGAAFGGADLCGADMTNARNVKIKNGLRTHYFTKAKYDDATKFPDGFDPVTEGMIKVDG